MKFVKRFWPLLACSLVFWGSGWEVLAKMPAIPTFKVENVEQLLQTLGPNRIIQLLPGVYHLEPGLVSTPYVKWKSPEQPTLVIHNVKNLSIKGNGLESTKLVSTRCKGELFDFEATSGLRLQGIGFGRMAPGKHQELDCSLGLRALEQEASPAFEPDVTKIRNWQRVAQDINHHRARGIELPEYTDPLYPQLLEQVRAQTQPLTPAQDVIAERTHSLRPRLGQGYRLNGKHIVNASQKPAQAAAMVFDRSLNLLAVFDANAQIILAVEGRNNTRQSWNYPAEWLMQKSMVPESNAPAPNGVYAFGALIKDSPIASHNFGSYRIVLNGGVLNRREILFHSRDHRLKREIPWRQDRNDEETRTLGCFLFQDPDLNQLAQLLRDATQPVALVVQGHYAKNLSSPDL